MDTLSQLIARLDPQGRLDLRCLFGPSFAAPHAAIGPWQAPFHIVLQGECELVLPEHGQQFRLTAGSLAVMPRGAAHDLRAGPANTMQGPRLVEGAVVDTKTNLAEGETATVELLCGEFEFGGRRRSALLEALPECFVITFGGQPDFAWLEGMVRLMSQEIEQEGPGSTVLVSRLAGALFTLALRAYLQGEHRLGSVLGLMQNPRLAPALHAMLEQAAQPWTVASLAALCHLSRASFAREFEQSTGQAPLGLLTSLRMEQAAQLLLQGDQDIASVGEAVGYQSEAAFSRAFKRHAGLTPGQFRRS